MENIKLPQSELAEMKQFYLDEYERLSRRLQHIRIMLDRMGAEVPDNGTTDQAPRVKQPGTASSRVSPAAPGKKKTGRKSKWELLIMKRLRQLDKPVTYDELTDEIMAFSKLPASRRNNTKQAVVNVIFRLRSRDRKLDTFSIGTREKYIALKGWFENPGEIKKEYSAKITAVPNKGKPKNARRGRPRKTPPTS